MAAVSAVPALLDALVSTLTAALPAVAVYDGPGTTDESTPDALYIGVDDPDAEEPGAAVESEVEWAALGTHARYETSTVNCAAVSWSGDGALSAVRARAFTTFAAVEQTLTADPSLGDIARFGGIADSHRVLQNQTADGPVVWVVFGVTFRARLSG